MRRKVDIIMSGRREFQQLPLYRIWLYIFLSAFGQCLASSLFRPRRLLRKRRGFFIRRKELAVRKSDE